MISSLSHENTCDVEVCYVSRSYMTRHGAGELPYKIPKNRLNPDIEDKTNVPNSWQGKLRYGQINLDDLTQRIKEDSYHYTVPIQQSIAFTHMNYSRGKIFTPEGLRSADSIEVDKIYKFFGEYI